MKKIPVRLLSLLAALSLTSGMQAFAVDGAPAPYAEPLFPLEHAGDGLLCVSAQDAITYHIELLQHSPERENLVLYNSTVTLSPGEGMNYALEAGDYTLRISSAASADGLAPQTAEQTFTVDNPDMTGHTTEISETLSVDQYSDYLSSTPQQYESYSSITSTVYSYHRQITFTRYDRLRGDFDGDGEISTKDARGALNMHVMRLASLEQDCSAGQTAVCDFNGSGYLDMEDAKTILNYVVSKLAQMDPEWPS